MQPQSLSRVRGRPRYEASGSQGFDFRLCTCATETYKIENDQP